MHVQPFQIVFLLVGHKCDLVSQREVTREEAEKLSSDCGMKYIETSAKDATNVEESFTILTRDIYELHIGCSEDDANLNNRIIILKQY
uniref:RAB39A, member RAS oncogene family n=1 Tax=Athene cunicularia TaxID=194338 RepID=A0A663LSK9_ATHCN